jgi:predicted nucleotidyltransferase
MRLTEYQAKIIKENCQTIFGEQAQVYLFGSRTDDNRRGGDIDLYIIPVSHENLLEKELSLAARLQQQLGDQRIDIVLSRDKNRPIEQQAIQTGVKL